MPRYESPINIYSADVSGDTSIFTEVVKKSAEAADNYIYGQIKKLVVDVDKDELIKALSYDRDQYYKGYADRDNEIVRCKDCMHWDRNWESRTEIHYCPMIDGSTGGDFFCADGERKVDDT